MQKIYRFCFVVITTLCIGFGSSMAQPNKPFSRFPSISPDGSEVAFSYQGDIWVVPVDGGRAWRLTLHEAYEAHPQWSPDGKKIAFTSDRFGNDDLFVMSADGSKPKRITFHSAGDDLGGWTPDNKLVFTTRRVYQQVEWEPEIHQVSAEGGTPIRMLNAVGLMPRMSPDGRFLAFVRGYNREYRYDYRGPANKDIWIYDTRNESYRQLTDFRGNDMYPAFSDARTLFFVSERDGTHNLYRVGLNDDGSYNGTPEQLTEYEGDGIRYFDVSKNGQTVVFERKTGLYVLNTANGNVRSLDIETPGDDRYYAVENKTFKEDAESFDISPNGKLMAYVVHGEVFVKRNEADKSRSRRLTHHPWRDREVAFLNDSTLIFTSDRNNQYDLFAIQSADPGESSLYQSLKHKVTRLTQTDEDERGPVVSPDKKKVAYVRGRGELVVTEIEDGNKLGDETRLLDGWATPEDITWSPDSKWLAYAKPDLDFNTEVYIHAADNSREPYNVSKHPRPDYGIAWSPDGSKIAFLSSRNNGDNDIWFAWLKKEDWEKTKLDWEETGENKADTAVKDVEIDFDGLYKRMQQVTSLPGNESDIAISKDGETFYFVTNRNSRQRFNADQDLFQVKWDGTGMKPLTQGDQAPYDVRFGPKDKSLFMMKRGGHIAKVDPAKGDLEMLPFSARMEIDHPAEREQIFEEAWRALNKNFYDPDFHGDNWKELHDHYKPWAMKTSTKRDFQDVFNMMLGELNASHMGLYTDDRAERQEIRTGLLGVEIQPVEAGVRITHVVPDAPADREESKLREGEIITAVDGTAVPSVSNFYSLLSDKVEEETVLKVQGTDGKEREVVIQPTGSLSDELYNEWVDERKALVDQFSDGRLGYIHIEGMNWPSFERFERELVASGEGKEGLVIDVRYNGGGWTTDYLMTVLSVQQHAYTIPRGATDHLEKNKTKFRNHYPFGERLPLSAWTRPTIALCNQNSYSNAEIFSHAYKTLNMGTLVGEKTFGAVISTGGMGLMDGSFVRLPFRGWYVKATDENMEHGPAVPDIEVDNPPTYRDNGQDLQLKKAVETLLQQIDAEKR